MGVFDDLIDSGYFEDHVDETGAPGLVKPHSIHGYDPYSNNHPQISIHYFGGPMHLAKAGLDTGGDSDRRTVTYFSLAFDTSGALTPSTSDIAMEAGYEINPAGLGADAPDAVRYIPRNDYLSMRGEGRTIQRVINTCINGLPQTSPNGFLDINDKFINRIQTRYTKSNASGDSFSTSRMGDSWAYNVNYGFDGDGDGIEFESWYTSDYHGLGWSALHGRYKTLARLDRNSYGVRGMTSDDHTASYDDFFPLVELMLSSGGDADAFLGAEVNPTVEVPLYHTVGVLKHDWGWYEDPNGDSAQINEDLETMAEGGTAVNKWYCGGNPNSGYWSDTSTISIFNPFGSDIDIPLHNAYKVSYSYAMTSYPSITENIKSRFKTKAYIQLFSSSLIEDRVDKIASALTTTIERHADIKIQKNQPLDHILVSAIGEDRSYEENGIPDTSISGTDSTSGTGMESSMGSGGFTGGSVY